MYKGATECNLLLEEPCMHSHQLLKVVRPLKSRVPPSALIWKHLNRVLKGPGNAQKMCTS